MLYWLKRLEDETRIPVLPVYVDSPMAIEGLRLHVSRPTSWTGGPGLGKLTAFATRHFESVTSPRQSADLVQSTRPAIIVSSSGMATGGRVLHHLDRVLPDPRHTVLFVGFQAAGTRGRLLVDGAKTVKILGDLVPVAARVEKIDAMSAHADQGEILRWLGGLLPPPGSDVPRARRARRQDALERQDRRRPRLGRAQPQHRETVNGDAHRDARPRLHTCSSESTMRPSSSCTPTASSGCRLHEKSLVWHL